MPHITTEAATTNSDWTVVESVSMSYEELCREGVILWVHKNTVGNWSMLSQTTFIFEDATDALMMKLHFRI